MENNLKICLYDIETTPLVSYTWGTWEVNVIEIIEESYILSFAYKFLGDKGVKAYCINDFKGDLESKKKQLVKKLWEVLDESDVVVAHNGNNFDVKISNREFIRYGMTPPSPYKQIDTLSIARSKFRFQSNRLNELGKYLGLGCKVETGGFPLWKQCMAGDKKAFKKMVKYNKQDVSLLEKVYLRFLPYITNHPKMSIDDTKTCPNCGSEHIIKRGTRPSGNNLVQRWVCMDCGKWATSNSINMISKDNRIK
jgi:DNA polymerase III epsilon subunit-like protein